MNEVGLLSEVMSGLVPVSDIDDYPPSTARYCRNQLRLSAWPSNS